MHVRLACALFLIFAVLTGTSAEAKGPAAPPKVRWVPGEILVQVDPALVLPESAIDGKHPDFSRATFKGKQVPGIEALNLRFGIEDSAWVLPRYRPSQMDALRNAHTSKSISAKKLELMSSLGRWVRIKANSSVDVPAMVKAYSALAEVTKAEPNYLFNVTDAAPDRSTVGSAIHRASSHNVRTQTAFIPNDPSFGSQWGLSYINAPNAWGVTRGSASTVIAVIDTGVDLNHPDLASKIWANPFEAPGDANSDGCPGRCGTDDDGDGLIDEDGTGIQEGQSGWNAAYAADDDENGYIDDFNGWNFVAGNSNPQDDQGHGSVVAGIAGAATNNAVGIAGACPNCMIMPLKAFDSSGIGNTTNIIAAVDYAWRNGATIVVMSFGTYADSSVLETELQLAYPTATLVAAAGNDSLARATSTTNCPTINPFYPAASPYVLGVEALNSDGTHASFSNCGYELAAPGAGILSTLWANTYATWSGTSMAAPFVAGVAGLVRSQHVSDPTWTSDLINAQLVRANGDADQAVTLVPSPELQFVGDAILDTVGSCPTCNGNGVANPGETVNVVVTVHNAWKSATGVSGTITTSDPFATIVKGTSATFGSSGSISLGASGDNLSDPFRIAIDPSTPDNHQTVLNLTVTDSNGGTGISQPITLTVSRSVTKGGLMSADETWTPDNVYLVTSNLTVNQNVTLTIQPGTHVVFSSGVLVDIQPGGTLVARGTPSARILFKSDATWDGFTFETGATPAILDTNGNWLSGNVLEYCEIDNVDVDPNSLQEEFIVSSPILIRSSIIRVANDTRLYLNGGAIFQKNYSEATIFLTTAPGDSATIENNTIYTLGTNPTFWVDFVNGSTAGNYVFDHNNITRMPGGTLFSCLNCPPTLQIINNYWTTTTASNLSHWIGGTTNYTPFLTAPDPIAPGMVSNIQLSPVSPVGIGRVTFTVTFSKPMNTAILPQVYFGLAAPFNSNAANINPAWSSDGTTFTVQADITTLTGDGTQIVIVKNAEDLEGNPMPYADPTIFDSRFSFVIATTSIASSNLQATPHPGYIGLIWNASTQPDLAGYNAYRSTASNGTYTRLNSQLINTNSYSDTAVSAGSTYYYAFRIVNTQAQEGPDSNIATATAPDNIPPVIVHTVVKSAPAGLTITISAAITDNIAVPTGTLYYRPLGSTGAYTSKAMINATGSQYTANIPGASATAPGVEYYIQATDGVNIVHNGNPVSPHPITIVYPTLSIGDVSVVEGNSGTSLATFTVTLSQASGVAVTYDIATANGTAVSGSDYVASSLIGQSIPAGQTSKTFAVTINGDSAQEANETFLVNLSNPTWATLADSQAVGTIQNDDGPSMSIGDVSVVEGNSGTKLVTFTVSLSQTSAVAVTYDIATANGTATAGSDYVAKTLTGQSIAAGQTSKTFAVTINGDTTIEGDETFLVNLSNSAFATIADAQAAGTIQNDDGGPALSIGDVSVTEGNSGTKVATFTVSLAQPSTDAVSYYFATADGTATAGSDYVARTLTKQTIAAGQTSAKINVSINGDTTAEGNETFFVNISNPSFATIADAQAVATIQNDDGPSLSIGDVSVTEGNSGTKLAAFTVTLSQASTDPVSFYYATADGTATAGNDYVAQALTKLTVAAGQTSKKFNITINGDTTPETNETFFVNLSNPSFATIADAQAMGTIQNDDGPTLSIGDVSVTEGNSGTKLAAFTVTLSQASTDPVSFYFATADGTATAGSDYVAQALTKLTVAAGQTSKKFNITINGDTTVESDETFFVNLSNPSFAKIADAQAIGTILNDDGLLISIAAVQGPGRLSPMQGQTVTIAGIVTALFADGFTLQTPDAEQDRDPSTSEGIFVSVGKTPAANLVVGASATVTGMVQEVLRGRQKSQLTQTQVASTNVKVTATGQSLPKPITLAPVSANTATIDHWERYEGMRVSVPALTVAAPVGGTIDEATAKVTLDGRFYGVPRGTPRPFREPGADALNPAPAAIGKQVFDDNPERLMIDSRRQSGATLFAADAGDTVSGLVGVLGYGDGTYQLWPDPNGAAKVQAGAKIRPVPLAGELTIGQLNLGRFFDDVDDRKTIAPVATAKAYAMRLAKTANAICVYVRNPAILGVAEVENQHVLSDLAEAVNSHAGNVLFPKACTSQPDYRPAGSGTAGADGALGFLVSTSEVRPGVPRVQVEASSVLAQGVQFRQADGSNEVLFATAPVLLQARLNSRNSDATDLTILLATMLPTEGVDEDAPATRGWHTQGAYLRAKRQAQALWLANWLQSRQSAQPAEKLVVLGAFHANAFDDGQADLVGLITGLSTGSARAHDASGSPASRPFANLIESVPATERYTDIAQGNAEATDHILVNRALLDSAYRLRLDFARLNADFGLDNYDDFHVPMRTSAHDPMVLTLEKH